MPSRTTTAPAADGEERWFTKKQVAALRGVDDKTIQRALPTAENAAKGQVRLPNARRDGEGKNAAWLIPGSDLVAAGWCTEDDLAADGGSTPEQARGRQRDDRELARLREENAALRASDQAKTMLLRLRLAAVAVRPPRLATTRRPRSPASGRGRGMTWLLIALGAAIGAPARYLLDTLITSRRRSAPPIGTLVVNVLGCALLGALAAASGHDTLTYTAIGTGFCGAFTTFSTFTWETFALAEGGAPGAAITNIAVSLGLGLSAASLTYWLISA